jgi:hypothetical protein
MQRHPAHLTHRLKGPDPLIRFDLMTTLYIRHHLPLRLPLTGQTTSALPIKPTMLNQKKIISPLLPPMKEQIMSPLSHITPLAPRRMVTSVLIMLIILPPHTQLQVIRVMQALQVNTMMRLEPYVCRIWKYFVELTLFHLLGSTGAGSMDADPSYSEGMSHRVAAASALPPMSGARIRHTAVSPHDLLLQTARLMLFVSTGLFIAGSSLRIFLPTLFFLIVCAYVLTPSHFFHLRLL